MAESREKLIDQIMESFHVIKNKIHVNFLKRGKNNNDCVTHSQLSVLAIIKRNPGISIKGIAERIHVSPSAATQLVDGLVEMGYATRTADAKDRRALQLDVSAKGLKYLSTFKERYMKTVAVLFGGLSDQELEIYLKLHKKMLFSVLEKK